MPYRPLSSYFLDYAMGKLTRETLREHVPVPVILFNPHQESTSTVSMSTTSVNQPDVIAVYRSPGLYRGEYGKGFLIGRGRGADLSIEEDGVSRRHCFIAVQEGRWSIADLGSSNGTALFRLQANETVPVPEHPRSMELPASSYVRFGSQWYRFLTPPHFFALVRRKAEEIRRTHQS